MLYLINDLPAHVIGIHATGKVTRIDYETILLPRLDAMVKQQSKINYIFILETNRPNFSLTYGGED